VIGGETNFCKASEVDDRRKEDHRSFHKAEYNLMMGDEKVLRGKRSRAGHRSSIFRLVPMFISNAIIRQKNV
jgi:hypothetical protein